MTTAELATYEPSEQAQAFIDRCTLAAHAVTAIAYHQEPQIPTKVIEERVSVPDGVEWVSRAALEALGGQLQPDGTTKPVYSVISYKNIDRAANQGQPLIISRKSPARNR